MGDALRPAPRGARARGRAGRPFPGRGRAAPAARVLRAGGATLALLLAVACGEKPKDPPPPPGGTEASEPALVWPVRVRDAATGRPLGGAAVRRLLHRPEAGGGRHLDGPAVWPALGLVRSDAEGRARLVPARGKKALLGGGEAVYWHALWTSEDRSTGREALVPADGPELLLGPLDGLELSGRVTVNGWPLPGVVIQITQSGPSPRQHRDLTTDPRGWFFFRGPPLLPGLKVSHVSVRPDLFTLRQALAKLRAAGRLDPEAELRVDELGLHQLAPEAGARHRLDFSIPVSGPSPRLLWARIRGGPLPDGFAYVVETEAGEFVAAGERPTAPELENGVRSFWIGATPPGPTQEALRAGAARCVLRVDGRIASVPARQVGEDLVLTWPDPVPWRRGRVLTGRLAGPAPAEGAAWRVVVDRGVHAARGAWAEAPVQRDGSLRVDGLPPTGTLRVAVVPAPLRQGWRFAGRPASEWPPDAQQAPELEPIQPEDLPLRPR